jgi:hypothetical protein
MKRIIEDEEIETIIELINTRKMLEAKTMLKMLP